MTNPRTLQLLNTAAFLATLAVNALVNILPLNGVTTAQVSDSYPNLFTPPGYVFAIWGVIYTLAAIYAGYQARGSQTREAYITRIGTLYALSAALNMAWLAAFHYSYGAPSLYLLSTLILLGLLATLIQIYRQFDIGGAPVNHGVKLGVHAHLSIYLGWISLAAISAVASAINLLVPGISVEVQALGTAAMLVVALALTGAVLFLRRDILFAAVVVWASTGIALKQQAIPVIYWAALGTAVTVSVVSTTLPLLNKKGFTEHYLQ